MICEDVYCFVLFFRSMFLLHQAYDIAICISKSSADNDHIYAFYREEYFPKICLQMQME